MKSYTHNIDHSNCLPPQHHDSMLTLPLITKFILTIIRATKTILLNVVWSILPTILGTIKPRVGSHSSPGTLAACEDAVADFSSCRYRSLNSGL